MAIEKIDHPKTKAHHPQTIGICERFHRTLQDEFYALAFRKQTYVSIEQLQANRDEWVERYNHERIHSGKHCFGRRPWQTFKETKHLAQVKQLDTLLNKVRGCQIFQMTSLKKSSVKSPLSDLILSNT